MIRRIAMAIVVAVLLAPVAAASQAPAAPAGSKAGHRSAVVTKKLTSSKSVAVVKQYWTRTYTRGACAAMAKVSSPVITNGGSKAARASFTRRINAIVDSQVDAGIGDILDWAIADNSAGRRCRSSDAKGNVVELSVAAATVYKNRYVSVALKVRNSYVWGASSCRDGYITVTFDTKTGKFKKLSDFASDNHNQLSFEVSSRFAKLASGFDYDFSAVAWPDLYLAGRRPWTVGAKGVTFWSASGSDGRSCASGTKRLTVGWADLIAPGDTKGKARVYKNIPVKWDSRSAKVVARATVTVKGKQVRVSWTYSDGNKGTYWGVRSGRKLTRLWARSGDPAPTPSGISASVSFASSKKTAKPKLVTYAVYD